MVVMNMCTAILEFERSEKLIEFVASGNLNHAMLQNSDSYATAPPVRSKSR